MTKAEELLTKVEEEMETEAAKAVAENATEIEEAAKAAYLQKKAQMEAHVKERVLAPYLKAKEYLLQVVEAEKAEPEQLRIEDPALETPMTPTSSEVI